jgi:hypothetical protein
MSALKERAKQLIDQLPDEVVSQLLEDLEDALDLERPSQPLIQAKQLSCTNSCAA